MSQGARERPSPDVHFGLPEDGALTARLFPGLPGKVNWGLGRTERILGSLGEPHRDYPVLHVGGTNGKGSVARIWAKVLQAAGFQTGLYTSPHLVSFRERILVDGRPVRDDLLEDWSRELRPLLVREAPSFFEAATALAFLAFARTGVDVAVVEVGMGGRLDATNVASPILTAITNVGLDHTEMLGKGIEQIAREKAGIFKPGVPIFTSAEDPTVLAVLTEEAAIRDAPLCRVPVPEGAIRLDGASVRLMTRRWGALELETPLTGRHQLRNLSLAVHSLDALPPGLPVSASAVRAGVRETRVPGRFQVEREKDLMWILDAAHNLDAFRALRETIEELDPPQPRIGIVGILADKPWAGMLRELEGVLDRVIVAVPGSAPSSRIWDPSLAADVLPAERVAVHPRIDLAMEAARTLAGPSGTVIVTGSSYTVGECLTALGKIPPEALPLPFASG